MPQDGTLDVEICDGQASPKGRFAFLSRSVVTDHLARFFSRETLIRENGLHLLLVCTRTRNEVLPFLSNLTVRFHCPCCFKELLNNLSHGLGVGIHWMKHVEITFTCRDPPVPPEQPPLYHGYGYGHGHGRRRMTPDLSRFMATEQAGEAMSEARRIAWLYYGRLDLTEQEKWTCEPIKDNTFTARGIEQRNALAPGTYLLTAGGGTQEGAAGADGNGGPSGPYYATRTLGDHLLNPLTGHLTTSLPTYKKWLVSGWFHV